MNKKGFVFVETIITIVFLAAALLILYTSYRSAITEEKEKVYYDDIGYLYRNYYIADYLINKSDIYQKKNTLFEEKYIIEITRDNVDSIFTPEQNSTNNANELLNIKERFNVNRMLLVSDDVIVECGQENEICKKSYEGLSDGLTEYIKTMEIETPEDGERRTNYYLVTEYREKSTENGIEKCSNDEEGCGTFYVKLKLDINKVVENDELTIGKVCKGQNLSQCIKENYDIENVEDDGENRSGIFHHDGNGDDSGNGEKEAKDDSYRYGGNLVNNWVCFGSDAPTCPPENMYRIIGVFGKNLKIIKNESDNKTWNSTDTITKNYDPKWNNMIISKAWNIDGMAESELSKDALGIYQAEIKGNTKDVKQGLMYVSDYMYGASPNYWNSLANNYSEAKEHNWLFKSLEWTVSGVKNTSKAFAISDVGNVGSNNKSSSSASRINHYLKDTIILVSGEGTENDPFRIADIGVVISDLSGEESYEDITVNVEATTSEGTIVEYYYSIYKDGEWSNWEKDTESSHKFEGLKPGTDYKIKVKALNSLGNYSEEVEKDFKTLVRDGWVNEECRVYYKDGARVRGLQTIEGNQYYFDKSTGCMRTGWVADDSFQNCPSHYYYFNKSSGQAVVGWFLDEAYDSWFYLSRGQNRTNTNVYYARGCMYTGWLQNNEYSQCASHWYYFDENGYMKVGRRTVPYSNNSSRKATFYFNPASGGKKGCMTTGWVWDECWRYFGSDGPMWTSGSIDGWSIKSDGCGYVPSSGGGGSTGGGGTTNCCPHGGSKSGSRCYYQCDCQQYACYSGNGTLQYNCSGSSPCSCDAGISRCVSNTCSYAASC